MFAKLFARIKSLIQYIRENRFDRSLMRYFDWPLLIMVLTISLFGVVCIFTATAASEVSDSAVQPSWRCCRPSPSPTRAFSFCGCWPAWWPCSPSSTSATTLYGRYAHYIYVLNIAILLFALVRGQGRTRRV